MEKTVRGEGFPDVSLRTLGVHDCGRFSTLYAICYEKSFRRVPGNCVSYNLEYGTATLVVSQDSIQPGDKVLVVDDLLATGGSAKALCELVERSGASVAAVMFYIELTPLKGRKVLEKYPVISIVPVEAY